MKKVNKRIDKKKPTSIENYFSKYLKYLPFFLIPIMGFLVYSNSFQNGFHYDDNYLIMNNPKIGDFFYYLFSKNWFKFFGNRQLSLLTYSLNYNIHEYNLFGYHLFNLLVHIISSVVVYFLSLNIIKLLNEKINENQYRIFALFCSMIFLLHPVQTEPVNYITQRMALLAGMFVLLSSLTYIKFRINLIAQNHSKAIIYFILVIIFFYLSISSKENGFVFVLIVPLFELFIIRNKEGKIDFRFLLIYLIVFIIIIILFLVFYNLPTPAKDHTRSEYLFTQFKVIFEYYKLLLLPINQHVLHYIILSKSFFEFTTILAFLGNLLIIGLAIYFSKKYKVIVLGVFWFYISLVIESTIIPLQYLINEYRLYLGVFGFGLALSYLLIFIIFKNKNYAYSILTIYLIVLGALSFNRNYVWIDSITLWKNNIEAAPQHPEPYNNLGYYYNENNMPFEALKVLDKAIELKNDYESAYNHRGTSYFKLGNFPRSLIEFEKAIKLDSTDYMALCNMGSALASVGRVQESKEYFLKSINYRNDYYRAYYNLGNYFYLVNEFDSALIYFKKSIDYNKYYDKSFNNIGVIYLIKKDYNNAYKYFNDAITNNANYPEAYNNLALVYRNWNQYDKSLEYHNLALYYNPNYAEAYFQRAVTYYNLKQLNNAINDLNICLKINPNHREAAVLFNQLTQIKDIVN